MGQMSRSRVRSHSQYILEHDIGLGLSRTLWVGVVEEILDAQQDLTGEID